MRTQRRFRKSLITPFCPSFLFFFFGFPFWLAASCFLFSPTHLHTCLFSVPPRQLLFPFTHFFGFPHPFCFPISPFLLLPSKVLFSFPPIFYFGILPTHIPSSLAVYSATSPDFRALPASSSPLSEFARSPPPSSELFQLPPSSVLHLSASHLHHQYSA